MPFPSSNISRLLHLLTTKPLGHPLLGILLAVLPLAGGTPASFAQELEVDEESVPPYEEAYPPIFMLSANGAALTIQRSDLEPRARLQFPTAAGLEIYAGPIKEEEGVISLRVPMANDGHEAGIVVKIEHDAMLTRATISVEGFGHLPDGQPVPVPYTGDEFKTVSGEEFLAFARSEATRAEEHLQRVIAECEANRASWRPSFVRAMELQTHWEAETSEQLLYTHGLSRATAAFAPEYWFAVAQERATRATFLLAGLCTTPIQGIEGTYIDGAGGYLTLKEAADDPTKLEFEFFVIRGPSAHIGSIKAVATKLSENRALFIDTNEDLFVAGKPATIELLFSGHEVEVRSENTMSYHGVRAFFDGIYYQKSAAP